MGESDGLDIETYLRMCEELGEEPDPERLPPDLADLCPEARLAVQVIGMFTPIYVGMEGVFVGRDLSILPFVVENWDVGDIQLFTVFINDIIQAQVDVENSQRKRRNKHKARR